MIYNADNFPELPHGWTSLTVDNSVENTGNSNKKLKTKDALDYGRFPVIDQGKSDISGYSDNESLVVDASESSPVILFGDHTRLLKKISQPFVPGADGTKLFRAKSFWDTRFVYQMLRAIKLPDKGYARHYQYLRDSVLPLPPINEQKRIADKLDAVLARVDTCRDRLDRLPATLKRFRQSVLAAATSGKLSEDWRSTNIGTGSGLEVIALDAKAKAAILKRDESLAKKKSSANSDIDESYTFDLPETWAFTTWGRISEWITYGFTRPMPSASQGIKLVTAKDVLNFGIRFDSAGYTTNEAFSVLSDKDRPKKGDLLITKDGTIGRAAIVNSDEPFCINQSVAVCWLRSTSMNKRYLELVVNAEFTQRFVFDKSKGMAIQHLSIIDLAQCPVPVPSLREQTEIVRRVEALFALADRLEARYAAARAQVEKLTPATLAKAFRGELVPQDPNDEPASELLERIATQLAIPSEPKTRKPRVPRAPKEIDSMTKSRQDDDVKGKPYLAEHLRRLESPATAEALFKVAELSVADFYKQLAWEVAEGHVKDGQDLLEHRDAA